MKTATNKTMGFDLNIEVPSSVEEYDKLAGRVGACLDDANQYNLFHSWNGEFRPKFVEAFEKQTGIKRQLNQEAIDKAPARKDGTKPEIFEQEAKYFKRALAELGEDISKYQSLAEAVARQVKFDPSEGTRSGGKVGKEYMSAAQQVFDAEESSPGAIEKVVTRLQELNNITIEIDFETIQPTLESLARAIKINEDRKRKQSVNELLA
jgi:hypothetical protein